MRVISGRFKGHHLVSFKADHIRPTTDRVKESLYNILQRDWSEAKVLDLFAGTGNLGIEALSRGAPVVTFVESHAVSLKILQENLQKLKIERNEYQLIRKDVFQYLKTVGQTPNFEKFDIVFADPPFTQKIAHDVLTAYAASGLWHPETVLAIESASTERLDDLYGEQIRIDAREFGDKILSFFQAKSVTEEHGK